jgi:hypothetical protein
MSCNPCDFCYDCDYKTIAVFLAGYYFKPFLTIAINVIGSPTEEATRRNKIFRKDR